MIPTKELDFNPKKYTFKIDIDNGYLRHKGRLCYNCQYVYYCLKKNSKSKIAKLNIVQHPHCECGDDLVISFYKTRKRENRSARFGERVGYVRLEYEENRLTTHSEVCPELKNVGFGLWMYSVAIDLATKAGFKISSSSSPSNEAKRLWRSQRLAKYYKVSKPKGKRNFPKLVTPKKGTVLATGNLPEFVTIKSKLLKQKKKKAPRKTR